MTPRTMQELFDTVATHLLSQNARAVAGHGETVDGGEMNCAYRGKDDLKCAVGCLITDEVYVKGMEGLCVHSLFDRFPDTMTGLGLRKGDHAEMLQRLQNIHDGHKPDQWRVQLNTYARLHSLNTEALK